MDPHLHTRSFRQTGYQELLILLRPQRVKIYHHTSVEKSVAERLRWVFVDPLFCLFKEQVYSDTSWVLECGVFISTHRFT